MPSVEMHAQLVDVGRDVPAPGLGCERGLLEAKDGCGEGGQALFVELTAGLQAFPGGGDLDADTAGVEVWGELLEVGY